MKVKEVCKGCNREVATAVGFGGPPLCADCVLGPPPKPHTFANPAKGTREEMIDFVETLRDAGWDRRKCFAQAQYFKDDYLHACNYVWDNRITGTALNRALDSLISD